MQINLAYSSTNPILTRYDIGVSIPKFPSVPIDPLQLKTLYDSFKEILNKIPEEAFTDPQAVAKFIYLEGKKNQAITITEICITISVEDGGEIGHAFGRNELEVSRIGS